MFKGGFIHWNTDLLMRRIRFKIFYCNNNNNFFVNSVRLISVVSYSLKVIHDDQIFTLFSEGSNSTSPERCSDWGREVKRYWGPKAKPGRKMCLLSTCVRLRWPSCRGTTSWRRPNMTSRSTPSEHRVTWPISFRWPRLSSSWRSRRHRCRWWSSPVGGSAGAGNGLARARDSRSEYIFVGFFSPFKCFIDFLILFSIHDVFL